METARIRPVAGTNEKPNFDPFVKDIDASPVEFQKMLVSVWSGIFQLPMMIGYGQFIDNGVLCNVWPLKDHESDALAAASVNLLKSIPSKSRKKWEEFLSSYLPAGAFISTLAAITYPRYVNTQLLLRAQLPGMPPTAPASGGTNGGTHGRNGSGEGEGTATPAHPIRSTGWHDGPGDPVS